MRGEEEDNDPKIMNMRWAVEEMIYREEGSHAATIIVEMMDKHHVSDEYDTDNNYEYEGETEFKEGGNNDGVGEQTIPMRGRGGGGWGV